tara:strand:- start:374 stop:598 length:225 start_codon:yes stop_codon:yes gene_type:complete
MKRKYVRFSRGVVTFPDGIIHSDVEQALERYMGATVSAGFTDGEECWGESISIGIKSKGDDDADCMRIGSGINY